MHPERLTAPATTAANNHSVVVALKREERPETSEVGALGSIAWMTLKDFANMSDGCGIRPSQMWAELQREGKRGPSVRLA